MHRSSGLQFLVLAGHGTGLGAMALYLRQFSSLGFLWEPISPKFDIQLSEFMESGHRLRGIAIESAEFGSCLKKILSLCVSRFPLIVMTRDPIDQLRSVVNTHIYYWALGTIGLSRQPLRETEFYKSGSILPLVTRLLHASNLWHTIEMLPVLSDHAGPILFTDVKDLNPGADQKTMSGISRMLYRTPHAWKVRSPQGLIFGRQNRFIKRISNLHYNDGTFCFSLELCPKEFSQFMGYDESLILSYDRDDVHFSSGNFKGDVSFIASHNEGFKDQISKEEFVCQVRKIVEADEKHILRMYCEYISMRNQTAEYIYNSLFFTHEGFLKLLFDDANCSETMEKIIGDFTDVLFACQCQLPESWSSSLEFLEQKRLNGYS